MIISSTEFIFLVLITMVVVIVIRDDYAREKIEEDVNSLVNMLKRAYSKFFNS